MPSSTAITQERGEDRVSFFVDGQLVTSYIFADPKASRPYWYPLNGPDGQGMTRRFPVEAPAPDEPTDHPHHRSLWCAHGDVNGIDNWNEPAGHAYSRFRRLEPQESPDTLVSHADWVDASDRLLCHERLFVRISAQEDGTRLLDWDVTLTAPADAPVTFGDTKEGGLVAVRVAAPLQESKGGQIAIADGGVGEKACWGKPSRWCDYTGRLTEGGETVGIAILSHLDSHGHPTHWHVRAYGLFAANPFGLAAFTSGAENGAVTVAPGESLRFHYAVVLHRGDAKAAGIERLWREWTAGSTRGPEGLR
jgi:hypothetical protein